MAALAGRGLRIKYSADGITYTAIVGSTSDNFSITKEGINITDKGDAGVQTFIDDAVGTWAMEGGFEGVLKDATIMALVNSTTQFTYDFQVDIAGIGTYEGKFGITNFNPTGAEGAEAVTFTATLVSSGTIAFTAA
jgi:predicted secreted protein